MIMRRAHLVGRPSRATPVPLPTRCRSAGPVPATCRPPAPTSPNLSPAHPRPPPLRSPDRRAPSTYHQISTPQPARDTLKRIVCPSQCSSPTASKHCPLLQTCSDDCCDIRTCSTRMSCLGTPTCQCASSFCRPVSHPTLETDPQTFDAAHAHRCCLQVCVGSRSQAATTLTTPAIGIGRSRARWGNPQRAMTGASLYEPLSTRHVPLLAPNPGRQRRLTLKMEAVCKCNAQAMRDASHAQGLAELHPARRSATMSDQVYLQYDVMSSAPERRCLHSRASMTIR